ncbi:MAG: HD domain-containing protein [Bauldia sp.]
MAKGKQRSLFPADQQSAPLRIREPRYAKTIRLAPPDDVRLTELEVAIIDTPAFQRLRGIKQLGATAWVYPTAVHTRFDHSIGVLKATDEMVTAIRMNLEQGDPGSTAGAPVDITDQQRTLARLYGLLHDITHVPFGHTLEDELRIFPSHDAFQKGAGSSEGLDRFEALLGWDSDIGKLIIDHLGRPVYERFRNVFLLGKVSRLPVTEDDGSETFDEFIYYIVSDTVCADLLDYLRRDGYFTGLEFRIPSRLLDYLYVADIQAPGSEDIRRRVVVRLWKPRSELPRRDVMTDIVGLLDSRYVLAERVYFHRTKIIVGAMIGRAVLEAKVAGVLDTKALTGFGDETLLSYLSGLDSAVGATTTHALASSLAKAVLGRKLYKCIKRYHREEFTNAKANEDPHGRLLTAFKLDISRRAIEDELAEMAGAAPGEVLVYVAPEKMNLKVAEAIVDWQRSPTLLRDLKGEDSLVQRLKAIEESHRRLWSVDIIVRDSLSEEVKENVILAFGARYFASDRATTSWETLLSRTIGLEPGLANVGQANVQKAIRSAAKDLTKSAVAAHQLSVREVMRETVRRHLPSD